MVSNHSKVRCFPLRSDYIHSTEKVIDLKGVDVYASLKKIRLPGSFTILYYYYLYYMFKLARSRREWVMSYRSYLLSSWWPKLDVPRETWRIRWTYFRKSGNGEMPGVATVVVACCCSRRTSCLMPRTLECCEATRPEKGFQQAAEIQLCITKEAAFFFWFFFVIQTLVLQPCRIFSEHHASIMISISPFAFCPIVWSLYFYIITTSPSSIFTNLWMLFYAPPVKVKSLGFPLKSTHGIPWGMDSFSIARDCRGWTALHTAAKSGQVHLSGDAGHTWRVFFAQVVKTTEHND